MINTQDAIFKFNELLTKEANPNWTRNGTTGDIGYISFTGALYIIHLYRQFDEKIKITYWFNNGKVINKNNPYDGTGRIGYINKCDFARFIDLINSAKDPYILLTDCKVICDDY